MRILNSSQIPVQVASGMANRERGLATGTDGIFLTLAEAANEGPKFAVDGVTCRQIFSAKVVLEDQTLIFSSPGEAIHKRILGDIFDGACSELWTDLVFGRRPKVRAFEAGARSVTTRGIGHGELIREFSLWVTRDWECGVKFETSEATYDSFGWCNGNAGLLAILATERALNGNSNLDEDSRKTLEALVLAIEQGNFREIGLCHGLAGACVTALGVARTFKISGIEDRVRQAWTLQAEKLRNAIPPHLEADASWLTGMAGVVWADAVLRNKPSVNPLLPIDSTAHEANAQDYSNHLASNS
jgi:hypothetical protein